MPYRRVRRRYGGRRRYRRRSYPASRAVPRTTYAPRHQYLKLRMPVNFRAQGAVGGTTDATFRILLDKMSNGIGRTLWNAPSTDTYPLGYNEYRSIFSKYIIHGLKINLTLSWYIATNDTFTRNVGWAYHTVPMGTNPSILTGTAASLGAYPLGGTAMMSPMRPVRIKRYMNNSRVAGVDVRKFDRFTKLWVAPDDSTNNCYLSWSCIVDDVPENNTIQCTGTVTYYVSAIAIKEDIGQEAALAVDALTEAHVPEFGEPTEPTIDHESALRSGVAQNKRTLSSLGLGGK